MMRKDDEEKSTFRKLFDLFCKVLGIVFIPIVWLLGALERPVKWFAIVFGAIVAVIFAAIVYIEFVGPLPRWGEVAAGTAAACVLWLIYAFESALGVACELWEAFKVVFQWGVVLLGFAALAFVVVFAIVDKLKARKG